MVQSAAENRETNYNASACNTCSKIYITQIYSYANVNTCSYLIRIIMYD